MFLDETIYKLTNSSLFRMPWKNAKLTQKKKTFYFVAESL